MKEKYYQEVNKRPYMLRTACYIGFIYYGIISLIFLAAIIAMIFNKQLLHIYNEEYGIIKEGFLIPGLLELMLYSVSFASIFWIWNRKRTGLYFLSFATIFLLILEIIAASVNWINIAIAIIIIITYLVSVNGKGRKKLTSASEDV